MPILKLLLQEYYNKHTERKKMNRILGYINLETEEDKQWGIREYKI